MTDQTFYYAGDRFTTLAELETVIYLVSIEIYLMNSIVSNLY